MGHSRTSGRLADPPTIEEVARAISQMSSNKSPGADSVPAEIYKHGGENLTSHLHQLFTKIWNEESVPQDFKDATVVHIYKRKGDISSCDNHRGISLLSGAGKFYPGFLLTGYLSTFLTTTCCRKVSADFDQGVAQLI